MAQEKTSTARQLAGHVFKGYRNGSEKPIQIVPCQVSGDGRQHDPSRQTYLVTISGTEVNDLSEQRGATGIPTDLQVGFNNKENALFLAAKDHILAECKPKPGSDLTPDLILAGHSEGGMVCQQLASDPDIKKKFNVRSVVTFGSPVVGKDYEGQVTRLANAADPIARASVDASLRPGDNVQEWRSDNRLRDNLASLHPLPATANAIYQHIDYPNQKIWGEYDAFGQKGGHVEISFDPNQVKRFPAPPMHKHADEAKETAKATQPEAGRDFRLGNFPHKSAERLDPEAVAQANERLWKENPELHGRQLNLGPQDAAYRKEWRQHYHEAEKEALKPHGRTHPQDSSRLDPEAVAQANERLWKENPELHGHQLTLGPQDAAYRKEWTQHYHEAEKKTLKPHGQAPSQDSSAPQHGPTRTGATAAPDQQSASPSSYHSDPTRAEERQAWKDKLGERGGQGQTKSKAHEPGEERSITSPNKQKAH